MAAVDYFLKIEGIDGESLDDKHKNEIELESFSFGVSQAGSFAFGSGGGAGKVQFQDFHFTSHVSKASPILFQKCVSGVHLKEATLSMRKAGGTQQDFIHIKMNDVLISSYQSGGSGNEILPTDQFSLNFAKIEYSFIPQNTDGGLLPAINVSWDLKLNKAL